MHTENRKGTFGFDLQFLKQYHKDLILLGDGSDAGARPDEAVSWGKIADGAISVKVYSEATVVWPIIMGESFVRNFEWAKRT